MEENPYNASDLNSVLHTLSSLNAPGITLRSASSSQTGTPDPRQARPLQTRTLREPTSTVSKKPSTTPAVDPSTITTWPAALRYVMRTVGQNEETQLRIRGLIRSQHNHERQWWKGREALLERQKARGDKKKELDAVLRSIGAPIGSPIDLKASSDANEEKSELESYDRQVHQACVQMADVLMAELRGMNIPFFGLQKSLIPDSDTPPTNHTDDASVDANSPRLTTSDLADLQRRMLGLLEDLCRE